MSVAGRRARVALIGAGPGDPGLMTERGRRRLVEADVIVADAGVPETILDLGAEDAQRILAPRDASAIARILVKAASQGSRVVHLLAGAGSRAEEEARAVAAAGMPVEVVPGVETESTEVRGPLSGRRIAVTRPRRQVEELARRLEDLGATVVVMSTIRLVPPEDWSALDAAVGRLAAYDWVLFTSANGVEAFGARLARAGLDARALAGCRLGVIGPGTARALVGLGLRADLMPDEYRAEGLLEALADRVGRGSRVLLVRAAEARNVLPDGLRARGAEVAVVPAYRTVQGGSPASRVEGLLVARRIDAITFTSPSTVDGFLALLPDGRAHQLLDGVLLAAIGPITADALARHGLRAGLCPGEYTIPALAEALADHFGALRDEETT